MVLPPSLLLFVPILGAMVAHAPVLRFDLVPGLKRPLDGGRTFRGRRIFGANKTWRGATVMFVGVLVATLALAQLPAYWGRIPAEVARHSPWIVGTLLGLGVVLGELPNSFVKRQIGIAEGTQRRSPLGVVVSVVDQGDFVLAIWLTLLPLYVLTVGEVLTAFLLVVAVHYAVNLIGYAIGARKAWL